jgi:hypothetical protein
MLTYDGEISTRGERQWRDLSIAQWDTRYYPYGEPIAWTHCRRILRATGLFVVSAYLPVRCGGTTCATRIVKQKTAPRCQRSVLIEYWVTPNGILFLSPVTLEAASADIMENPLRNRVPRIFHFFNLFDRTNRDNITLAKIIRVRIVKSEL